MSFSKAIECAKHCANRKLNFPTTNQPTDALRQEELGGVLTLIFDVVCSHRSGSQQSGKLLVSLEEMPYNVIHVFALIPSREQLEGEG